MTNEADHVRIGKRFIELLREYLTAEEFAEMLRRNATAYYQLHGCCASHDFCDANMPMQEALEGVMGFEMDAANEAHATLWNTAWAWAWANGLRG